MTHVDDTHQTWPRTPLILLGLEWFGSVTSVLLPMQQLRPQPLPLSIGAQASRECPEKSPQISLPIWSQHIMEDQCGWGWDSNLWFYFSIPSYKGTFISNWNHLRNHNLKNKKNDITKSCYTSHQLTTSWTTSLSSMSMASSSSGPKRFSSRIQVTVSSCRARVSSIRTTSSPADVNQQLVFRNLLPRWEKMTKLTCSFVFYIFWESI